jgi:hypothetical protein
MENSFIISLTNGGNHYTKSASFDSTLGRASPSQKSCSFLRCSKILTWTGNTYQAECFVMAAREEERSLRPFMLQCNIILPPAYSVYACVLCKQEHLPRMECIKELSCLKTPLLMFFDVQCKILAELIIRTAKVPFCKEHSISRNKLHSATYTKVFRT